MSLPQVGPQQKIIARIGALVDQADDELRAIFEDLDDAVKFGGTFEACVDARDALLRKLAPLLKQMKTETALGPNAQPEASNAR